MGALRVQEGNEGLFAWDQVDVGEDGQTLTFSGIHHPEAGADLDSPSWASSRVEFFPSDQAVGARLWLVLRPPGAPGVPPDSSRTVTARLDTPLDGRVVYDGRAALRQPRSKRSPTAARARWERVQPAGERTLVVYWHSAGMDELDHISADWLPDALALTVWINRDRGGRLSSRYNAALLGLDRPLAGRRVRRRPNP